MSEKAKAEIAAVYKALPLETAAEFEDLTMDLRNLGLIAPWDDLKAQVSAVRHEHNLCEIRDPKTFGSKLARRTHEVLPRYTRRT